MEIEAQSDSKLDLQPLWMHQYGRLKEAFAYLRYAPEYHVASARSEGSGEYAHMRKLASLRCSYIQRKDKTERPKSFPFVPLDVYCMFLCICDKHQNLNVASARSEGSCNSPEPSLLVQTK